MTRFLWTSGCSVVVVASALALAQHGPESVSPGTQPFEKSVVVSGLANPWEPTWGPDGMLWVTERSGKRVTRVDPVSGERRVVVTLDEAAAPGGQDGVLVMAMHPDLLRGSGHDYVYLAYTYVDRRLPPDPRVSDFRSRWSGRSVAALYEKSRNTMPPASPGWLTDTAYADILAHILEVNGVAGGVAIVHVEHQETMASVLEHTAPPCLHVWSAASRP